MSRPREFNREEALQKALHTFWEKGYEGTKLPDLLGRMGINRSSFYNTFGDKQTLFMEIMRFYNQRFAKKRFIRLRANKSVKQGFHEYFADNIAVAVGEGLPGGCLVTNTTTALNIAEPQIVESVLQSLPDMEQAFYAVLERGQKSGEIAKEKDICAIARLFIALSYGLNISARLHADREVLEDMVKAALSILD
jgi:TetR/AcrR family transcriptional regulator, transcriptional repressor for nem operon